MRMKNKKVIARLHIFFFLERGFTHVDNSRAKNGPVTGIFGLKVKYAIRLGGSLPFTKKLT